MSGASFHRRERCPACASDTLATLYESAYDRPPIQDYLKDFYSAIGGVETEYLEGCLYVLCECAVCSLIFQRDIPNDMLMERLYERWIDPQKIFDKHEREDGLRYYSSHAQELMQIMSVLGAMPASLRCFDFAMGWSRWAAMVRAFGCQSYGSELSATRIEHARAQGLNVIGWDDIPQYRFDFINAEKVFEHIPEPLATLRHLKKALKADGLLRIHVPTAADMHRRLERMDWSAPKGSRYSLNAVAPLEHINCYRRSSLTRMAQEAGMTEVFIPMKTQYRYTTDWDGAKKIVQSLLAPIKRNLFKTINCIFLRSIG